jgi:hypothetical protein
MSVILSLEYRERLAYRESAWQSFSLEIVSLFLAYDRTLHEAKYVREAMLSFFQVSDNVIFLLSLISVVREGLLPGGHVILCLEWRWRHSSSESHSGLRHQVRLW